jgi:hydrogenase expression/formation protein HypE
VNNTRTQLSWQKHCPVALSEDDKRITLAHGEGGRLMRQLIREHIAAAFDNDFLRCMDDAAQLPQIDGPLAISTDSYVVTPLFFPGGDIGSMAVYGTINDLAVSGAKPLWLTLSLIIEEGFPLNVLKCLLGRMADAVARTGVMVVAGDTKVVTKGAADGLFINTTGVGRIMSPVPRGPASLKVGDALIVSGPIGRHGIAVLTAREDFAFEPAPQSDSAPLFEVCQALRDRMGDEVRALRDATRGGVAAVLHEWAEASQLTLNIVEKLLPVTPDVRGACELLGIDPLHIANEGTMVVAVENNVAGEIIDILRQFPESEKAAVIGHVAERAVVPVTISRLLGTKQALDDPLGAPLPRIC